MLLTSVCHTRLSSATSWRPACMTISMAGSARTSAKGPGSRSPSSGSSTSTRASGPPSSTATWTRHSSERWRPSPMNSVSMPSRPVARARAMSLGEPRAVGPEDERDVDVVGDDQPEAPPEPDLARRRLLEVGAADDLLDALVGVVDDDREVVGEGAVVAAHHEVVDAG